MVNFNLGQTVMTALINARLMDDPHIFGQYIQQCLNRHGACDWGDMCDEDKEANDAALSIDQPGRLMSSYEHVEHPKIWIITEWDRSITTVLFPEEY